MAEFKPFAQAVRKRFAEMAREQKLEGNELASKSKEDLLAEYNSL